MSAAISLRCLARTDLPFADSVRALEGWNQTMRDWERFLALEPDGCFLAEDQGKPAGTATTITYGPELAWIGMVLVHPDFRRRGIGRALLRHCLEHLQRRAVRCLKLDATPAGKTVYEALGFRSEWTLTRWQRSGGSENATEPDEGIGDLNEVGLESVAALDANAFGVSRRKLLEALGTQSCEARVLTSDSHVLGYGLLREGSRALYLGPLIADCADSAIRVVRAMVHKSKGQAIFWDIPDQQGKAVAWAKANGFRPQRSLTRMYLGENANPGSPDNVFAIAGPEVG